MYCKINTACLNGIETIPIQVEVDLSPGLPVFDMVGNISGQVREGRERIKIALHSIGVLLPAKRLTINLSPAKVRKDGTSFDVPIAIAILCAMGMVNEDFAKEFTYVGELNLSGEILPVSGILPIVSDSVKRGNKKFIVPFSNLKEARLIWEAEVYGFHTIEDLIMFLSGNEYEEESMEDESITFQNMYDFRDVNGQPLLKRAAEISAAGMHNLLLIGPPGAGKTMIAERMPSILPNLTEKERLDISKIYSIRGMLLNNGKLLEHRPFRAPHHTITKVGMTGGGTDLLPGEISLAHTGVLFLDEMTEFDKSTLELLRQPLEDRHIQITRNSGSVNYPSDFLLLGAMNPCNCGYYPNMNLCRCSESIRRRYYNKLSQPLLDRIDLFVHAESLSYRDLTESKSNESSEAIRNRVEACQNIQLERFKGTEIFHNSQIPSSKMDQYCAITKEDQDFMEKAFEKYHLTGRTYHKILRVARTIADLDFEAEIQHRHLEEALIYRNPEEFLHAEVDR